MCNMPVLQDQLGHEKSLYNHLEYEFHAVQRAHGDLQRSLRSREAELSQVSAGLRQLLRAVRPVMPSLTDSVSHWCKTLVLHVQKEVLQSKTIEMEDRIAELSDQ